MKKTKVCNKCNIERPISWFCKHKLSPDGLQYDCKECRKKYNKKLRQNNPEKKKKDNKKWRQEHKEYNNTCKVKYNTIVNQIDYAEKTKKGQEGELLVKCTYCGKWFAPTIVAVSHRIQVLNGKREGESRLYCSENCKQACPSYRQILYWKSKKPATSREVSAQFRQLVLKRDDYMCQRCLATTEDEELHVHHIDGATQHPFVSNDLENGITLCKPCHKWVHSQKGCRYFDLRCPT